MPVDIEFTPSNQGVIMHGRGNVSAQELLSAIKNIYADERYLSLKCWIGDYSDSEKFTGNVHELQQISMLNKFESRRNPGILLALVGASDHSYGICRQFEPFNQDSHFVTRVFRNRQDADDWIRERLDK